MKQEISFYLRHPIQTLQTKGRQTLVSLDLASPPQGSTIEGFPTLPITEAAALLFVSQLSTVDRSGIEWSIDDTARLKSGQMPKGYPEHPTSW